MSEQKTLQQREKELQALLATPTGKEQLQELASRYSAASGRVRALGKSAVTFILVYERERGMISN
jgi:hypothetical protein